METKSIDDLLNNIIFIQNKKTNKNIDYNKITAEKIIAKNSNTKNPIYKLKIDDKLISKNNKFIVKYKCISCIKYHTVSFNNICKKINKNIIKCRICKEICEKKRINQSQFMINNKFAFGISFKKNIDPILVNNTDLIKISDAEFKEEESDFQHTYFRKHLTLSDFDRIKNRIISIQNNKFTDISQFQYVSTLKIYNQTKYNPYLYDIKNDNFEKIQYIKYQCDTCDNTFINRDLYVQKNKLKILCQACNFTNNIFKIRNTKNCNNEKITYQSKLELKFINYCNKNKILITNGPKINYIHNSKQKIYIVDFYLPQINSLIEIKDNHCWHKENKTNGKFDAKIDAVNELIKKNIYSEFILIYSNELNKKCNLISKKIKELCNIKI